MALPASFLDELRARTPLAAVVGRHVKLARSGRQMKGCCPFHGEKTPSFYVYDDGFHCFGCGAHGDAIGFVMRAEGATFPEAVARLAAEAGLEVPKPTPQAAEAERRRLDLHGVLDAAATVFARRLRSFEGRAALDYLRGRGLSDATIDGWGLGWSGEGRGALAAELAGQGAAPALLVAAGLMTTPEPDRASRDFFFGRVMFPIRDAQGRVISFGGRVLGDGQPKYLNGAETDLFAKRRTLFGLDRARAAVRTGQPIVVVEGYLDVIALHQAGFAGAVAPLGTALTEAQLDTVWRLSPEPVLCFDGDAAGGRAAERTIALALPQLEPDRTLKLLNLPSGDDPDSLVRGKGAAAFSALLARARPLVDALFEQQRQGARTPEALAAWKERLEAAARQIRHPGLAREYRSALLDAFFKARRGPAKGAARPAREGRPALSDAAAQAQIGRILVCLLLRHPALLHDEEETFAAIPLDPALHRLQRAMLDWLHGSQSLDAAALMNHLRASGNANEAEALTAAVAAALPPGAREAAMPAEALETFWHFVGLLRRSGLEAELAQAEQAFARLCDEATQRRVIALKNVQHRLYAGDPA